MHIFLLYRSRLVSAQQKQLNVFVQALRNPGFLVSTDNSVKTSTAHSIDPFPFGVICHDSVLFRGAGTKGE